MLEQNLDLIRKIVWSYVKSNEGLEFDDLFNEACLAVLEEQHRYNPERGKKTTFTYHVVTNHFNNLLKQDKETPVDAEYMEALLTDNEPTPEQEVIAQERWEELWSSLSPEAQAVYEILANGDIYLRTDKPRESRGILLKYLRQENWGWGKIWGAFRELKEVAQA